nr:hypothetical protein HK105_005074 [Polyrhizophydium stewartii]
MPKRMWSENRRLVGSSRPGCWTSSAIPRFARDQPGCSGNSEARARATTPPRLLPCTETVPANGRALAQPASRVRDGAACPPLADTLVRGRYDGDITIWSPQGRIHQVEYALEAVKQGSAAVGVRSNTHAVVLALKVGLVPYTLAFTLHRSSGELASYQKKVLKIDDHMGIAFAGLTSDARVLSTFLKNSLSITCVFLEAQINTQRYGKRPYGVGLLVIGYDETGPHLYECAPSGNYFDYLAMSIGARSQSARTYLERHVDAFANASVDELILHGLRSLRDTLQQDKELNINNCTIGIVGKGTSFTVIEGDSLQRYLDMLVDTEAPAAAPTAPPAGDAPADAAPMETD